jgi:Flp pilus assembly protein TadD
VATRWLPWAAEPWHALGEAQLALGDRAAARASFRRGLQKDSLDWTLWLGLALASDGDARRAATERATELNRFGVMLALGEGR